MRKSLLKRSAEQSHSDKEVTSVGKKPPLPVKQTQHGFSWGATEIVRATEIDQHAVLWIKSATQKLIVRITPFGVIRVEKHETRDGKPLRGRQSSN